MKPHSLLAAAVLMFALPTSAQESPSNGNADPPPAPSPDPDNSVQPVQAEVEGPPLGVPPPAEEPYEDALYAQDVLKVATSIGFAATGVVGLLSVINQPTAFGDGECADGPDPNVGSGIGGTWGCEGMSTLHGALGVGTTVLYVSEQVTGLAIPGDEPDHGVFHKVLTYTHVGGMVITPALGLLAAQPAIFGDEDTVDATWPKVGRTIHMFSAILTAGAYWTTTLIELTADSPPPEATAKKR